MLIPLLKHTWFFEKAKKIKNLVLETLDRIEARQAALDPMLASVLEALREIRNRSDAVTDQLTTLAHRLGEIERSIGAQHDTLEGSIVAAREGMAMRSDLDAIAARLEKLVTRQPGHSDLHPGDEEEPELGLVAHLGPLLPLRVAIDIGANVGKYSEALLEAGFEVHAFEPNPSVLAQLQTRLGARKKFTALGFALGARDGKLALHLLRDSSPERFWGDTSELATLTTHALPEALAYVDSIEVPVRTLDGLHQEGLVPAEVGFVKVDTEGFDLEVVRGMGSRRYPLLSVEFWDKELPFGGSGALNGLPDLTAELQGRGYRWWIVIYRVFPEHTARFYCNVAKSIERSWGNAFFFQDYALFSEAERWCAAVLPRTYFTATKLRDGLVVHAP